MLIWLGCEEVKQGGVVRMVVLESGDQGGECDAKKESWTARRVPGSCPGTATAHLLCGLGKIPFPLSASDFLSVKMVELNLRAPTDPCSVP